MKLAPQQQAAYDQVMAWFETDQKRLVLGGAAGTGKTTLSKKFQSVIENVHQGSFTGKAANVMREKGARNASTIHSALYVLTGEEDGEPQFVLNEDSDWASAGLVIVDEYSMLPEEIIDDIESIASKVLYLGDPFQLPPVKGECSLRPDIFLTEVHRQALESPILRAATDVREGRGIKFQREDGFIYQPTKGFDPEDYETADQIIVGLNKTRIAWNKRFRQKQGFDGFALPQRGDKLICIKNNRRKGLFNGMIGEAKTDARQVSFEQISLDFDDHEGLKVWDGTFKFRKEPPKGKDKNLEQFDYAYAITAHKSQGSEFDDVLIYNQPIGKDATERARWLYTAITRGKKNVKLVQP